MTLDLSAIEASLNDVEQKEAPVQDGYDHNIPPSPLLAQADDLLLELNMKQADPKLEHKLKCKKCKKPEKSKGYFEKQDIKRKQLKKLRKNK